MVQVTHTENYRCYSKRELITLTIVGVISLLLFIIFVALIMSGQNTSPQSSWLGTIDGFLLFGEAIYIMVVDWRGALTIRGSVKTHTLHKGQLVSTAPSYFLCYLLFPEIILPMYLIHAVMDYRTDKQRQLLEKKHQIAMMEAKLGILPITQGTCRVCDKPLQVGAEFCQFCGVTVTEQPKICSACATVTLPDAKWCPKCRNILSEEYPVS